jgi:hypothetical protein
VSKEGGRAAVAIEEGLLVGKGLVGVLKVEQTQGQRSRPGEEPGSG